MDQQIYYKYSKIELEQFATFKANFDPNEDEVRYDTEVQFSYDKEREVLCCKVSETLSQSSKLLAKAVMNSYFEIKHESIESLRQENKIIFAPQLLVQFASLCYGSLRGAIYVKTMDGPLQSCVLPPVYFGNIVNKPFIAVDKDAVPKEE